MYKRKRLLYELRGTVCLRIHYFYSPFHVIWSLSLNIACLDMKRWFTLAKALKHLGLLLQHIKWDVSKPQIQCRWLFVVVTALWFKPGGEGSLREQSADYLLQMHQGVKGHMESASHSSKVTG